VTGIPILPVVNVTISGEIDIATSQDMRDALAAEPGPAHLEVDMSAVTFMDASGIGVLLAARQRAVDGGGSLTLRAPSWAVRRLTGILGLDELLATPPDNWTSIIDSQLAQVKNWSHERSSPARWGTGPAVSCRCCGTTTD
jgi:anti-anti-sigma factor